MSSDDITKEQAKILASQIRGKCAYLQRLMTRMQAAGFPPDDPYYLLVEKAYDAVQHLWIRTHHMSCGMKPKTHL